MWDAHLQQWAEHCFEPPENVLLIENCSRVRVSTTLAFIEMAILIVCCCALLLLNLNEVALVQCVCRVCPLEQQKEVSSDFRHSLHSRSCGPHRRVRTASTIWHNDVTRKPPAHVFIRKFHLIFSYQKSIFPPSDNDKWSQMRPYIYEQMLEHIFLFPLFTCV